MNLLEKASKILAQPVCDHCLGRQFGQLLSGFRNEERGRIVRTIAAMAVDKEDYKGDMDFSNFTGYSFHNLELKEVPAAKKCSVCFGLFESMQKWLKKIEAKAKKHEFTTFLVGTKLSSALIGAEEDLWERVGIDYCEPLKAEINREIGKIVERKFGVRFNPKNPDVALILDFDSGRADIEVNPLFIYGEYQKLVRGIPQTKWPSRKYRTSVEQIIAAPFMAATKGAAHALHGQGREDIDARCLAWRPFVLEIAKPKKRKVTLNALAKKIPKNKVRVRKLHFSNIAEVRAIKEAKVDKTYRAVVECSNKIARKDMKKLRALVAVIYQKTPQRVLHRRADKARRRAVKSLRAKYVSPKKFVLVVRGEGGLYIKELVGGDEGRTRPSVSELLGTACRCRDLDVIRIHVKK